MSTPKELSKRCQSLVGWLLNIHGSAASPVLPLDTDKSISIIETYYIDNIDFSAP